MKKKLPVLLLLLSLFSCDYFDFHPYDGKTNSSIKKEYNKLNQERIYGIHGFSDTIRFVWFGDSGRSLKDLEDCVKHINKNDSITFVLHAGDLTEFGLKKEYEWATAILNKLKYPFLSLIGNHDIIGNGDKLFHKIFGPENFYLRLNDLLILCLNTNALEYDYTKSIPDFDFINAALQKNAYPTEEDSWKCKRTIVAMHAPPGGEQFNNNVKDAFHAKLKEFPSLQFCLYGHTHNYAVNYLFEDEIPYIACDDIGKRSYILFTITPDSYNYELIKF